MEILPFLACRLYQSVKDPKGAMFGFLQDLFVLSEILICCPILYAPLAFYQLLGWYLAHFYKIPLTFTLWKFARKSTDFFDSIRELKIIPLLVLAVALIAISVPKGEIDRPLWLCLLLISGGAALFGKGNNPLFLLQWSWFYKSQKTKSDWDFSNESARIDDPQFPLFRTSRYLGKKRLILPIKTRPHVLFLILESFRAKNVGCLEAELPLSPHFDKIAKEGMLFTQFHATSNLTACCSIASLLGIPPAPLHIRSMNYAHLHFHGLPKIFREKGYNSALIQGGNVAFDHGPEFFQKQGFETLIGKRDIEKESGPQSSTSWGVFDEHLMRYAAKWLNKQTSPTFMTLFTITNHHPWMTPDSWPKTGTPFLDSFAYTDWALGLFLKEAKLDNTLLFIFGDHGQESRSKDFEVNKNLYQENLHVPLLIHGLGNPSRIDTPASQIDLLPTVLDLFGWEGPHHSLGKSLLREAPPAPLFFSHPFDGTIRAVRDGKWKLIADGNAVELYDLEKDPDEREKIENPEVAHQLIEKMDQYQARLGVLYEENRFAKERPEGVQDLYLEVKDSLAFDDVALQKIEKNLSTLHLSHCLMLTDQGFSSLFTRHKRLEKLSLEGLDIAAADWPPLPYLMNFKAVNCPRLRGSWLSKLPSLRILTLSMIEGFTDEDLRSIEGLCAIQLSHMDRITDQGLAPLFQRHEHLTTVSLEECRAISDVSLSSLHGKILCQVSLISLPNITDEGIGALKDLPLQHLVIQNCPQITGATLPLLSKGVQVILANCPKINPQYLQDIKAWHV